MGKKKHQTYDGVGSKARDKVPFKKGLTKKKKEKKDFQKVKLKAGNLRPKGLNETKLEFQSKSILIREQLRQDLGPEHISDIILRLRKGTSSQKLAVLDTLKTRLQNDDVESWSPALQSLIDTCTSYISLESVSHYRSAFQSLKIIFSRVKSPECFYPLMPLLCQRLISLMTHLNDDVRERSVPVLELLIHQTYSSTLLTDYGLSILESLLQQLMKTSRSERQFIITIDTTTIGNNSGNARLLDCIAQLVNIVFDKYNDEQPTNKDSQRDEEQEKSLFDLFHQTKAKPYRIMDQVFQCRSDSQILSRVIDLLLKVLLQFWSEMRIHLGDRYHHRDALSCLWCCTRIFHRLMNSILSSQHYTELHSIIAQHSSSIHKHLLQNFPFDEHQGSDSLSSKQVQQKNLTVRRLNIHIIDLLSTQFPRIQEKMIKNLNQLTFQLKPEQMQPLLDYMFDLLNNNENLNSHETKDTLEYIEKCIRSFRDDTIIRQCIQGISKYIQRSINDLHTNSIAFRIICDSITLKIAKLDLEIITSLPVDDMVWFVFQVLRSPETEFNKNQRKEILERMTQIFSFELNPFSMLLNKIWIDYFAILKTSTGLEQRLLVTWLYGINGKQPLNNSFLLSLQQYIQWHWLEPESIHLLLGILLRQYDRHGENLCSMNDFSLFFFRLLFPSFKIDGYVTEKLNGIDANKTFKYSEITINHLQCLKNQRDNITEALWIRIENAFEKNKTKQLKWFEWTTLYSLISIDNEIFPDAIVQSRLAVHLIQTIQQMNHTSNQQMSQFILSRVQSSPALKRILKECLALTANDQELHARCISLLD
ncbi:unnamed protein product [Rotaria socialis]|uniref:Pre-rRNA-processing protein Ipi1 N-terminal domain-containing protein n=1 Tax=Rotaria socialis TaxID=392032 RepID=A0A817ZCX0_9BILA|nr:unnamed protein product [Rotaria socialis]CAF4550315.1 unnamed protein product [Rotaria socialis]